MFVDRIAFVTGEFTSAGDVSACSLEFVGSTLIQMASQLYLPVHALLFVSRVQEEKILD